MKKISLMLAAAVFAVSFQQLKAQTTADTNHVEIKKKVKTHPKGYTTTKTKIKGSGSAATAGVTANGSTPVVKPVVVTTPSAVVINTPPEQAPAPQPQTSTTTTTVTTKTPVKPAVTKVAVKKNTTVVHKKTTTPTKQ